METWQHNILYQFNMQDISKLYEYFNADGDMLTKYLMKVHIEEFYKNYIDILMTMETGLQNIPSTFN